MRWFNKDGRVYVGPVTDDEMDRIMRDMSTYGTGIACMAGNGRVETYVTLPFQLDVIRRLSIGAKGKEVHA